MLKFFLLERGFWTSDLSVAECTARLEGEIESVFDLLPVDGGFAGVVGEDWARVKRRRFWRNDFAPVLVLTFIPDRLGARVEYAVGPNLAARGFAILWMFMVVRTTPFMWPPTPIHLIPAAMILFFALIMAIGRLVSRPDELWLLEQVARIVEGRDATARP